MTFPIEEIPGGANLNDYKTTGWYIQSDSEEEPQWSNYPGKTQRGGWLEVVNNERFTWQTYTEYSSGIRQLAPRVWKRHYNPSRNPPWTAWSQVSGAPMWYQEATAGMGWENAHPSPIPPATKWGLALKDFEVTMRFQVKSTAAISSDNKGNFVGNVPVGEITDARFRPSTDVGVPVNVLGRSTCFALIRPNGEYLLTHTTSPNTTFGVGSEFEFSGSYSIAGDD